MSYCKRDYRVNLSSYALIFLDGKEINCTIIDLSLSGLKIEIYAEHYYSNPRMLADLVEVGDVIDFSVQEMHFDGLVKIVRKEVIDNTIYLSVNYDDVFFGLEQLPYRRKHYRKHCRSSGQLLVNNQAYEVISHDLSLSGIQVAVFDKPELDIDDDLILDFNHINVFAQSRLKWHKEEQEQHLLGFEFIQLVEPVKGIASFSQ